LDISWERLEETLERESADFQAKRDQAQSDLDSMIETLSLDATL